MFGSILGILSGGLRIVNKLLPSWEWKGGQAAERARQSKEAADDRAEMDAVPAPSERDVVDRLRKRGL